MGAPLTIYNLYQLFGGSERLLLVKGIRPEFPNASQSAEDAAMDAIGSYFSGMVAEQQSKLQFAEAKLIGTWEDACPEGDVFYSDQSEMPVDIWFAPDTKYQRYLVFGIADSEHDFWKNLHQLYADGDLWGFEEFARPAIQKRVWLVQQG